MDSKTKFKSDKSWNPAQILDPANDTKFALVVLNQPIRIKEEIFLRLWTKAVIRVSVDGGTNHLHKFSQTSNQSLVPDLITGDFDSIHREVMNNYQNMGSTVVETPDQSETDFTKCVRVLFDRLKSSLLSMEHIVVVTENGGRCDQIFANINTLFKVERFSTTDGLASFGRPSIYLVSGDSITWLMNAGHHRIDVPWPSNSTTGCALIPVGHPCHNISTSGFEWDLDDGRLEFGQLVSTSNRFNGTNPVHVSVSDPIIFTMGYPTR